MNYSKYFLLDSVRLKARCKLLVSSKVVKFTNSSKTNLKTHIEKWYESVITEAAADSKPQPKITDAIGKTPGIHVKQDVITKAVAQLIVDCNLSVRIVEAPLFCEFMLEVQPRLKFQI